MIDTESRVIAASSLVSVEAEQAVLGGLLLDNAALDRIPELRAEHFARTEHRTIFGALSAQIGGGKLADVLTVFEWLQARGDAEDCGGKVYLNALAESTPSAAGVKRYAGIVMDRAKARALLQVGGAVVDIAQDQSTPIDDRIEQASMELGKLLDQAAQREAVELGHSMALHIGTLEDREQGRIRSIPTGLQDVDDMLGGGVRRGNLVIVGARPSMGKTAFALTIALHMAREYGVGLLSMEMSLEEINDRATALLGHVDLGKLQRPQGQPDDFWGRVVEAVEVSKTRNCFVDDQGGLSLAQVRAKARAMKRKHGIDVLMVDYLQLMQGRDEKVARTYQLEEISRGLKALAKELDIAVIALAQVNRRAEERANSLPGMSDLKDSGAIEQDADVIAFIHRPIQLDPMLGEDWRYFARLVFAKNRQGRTGLVNLSYIGNETRFAAWSGPEPVKPAKAAGSTRKGFD